ncbi:hypothetical protein ACRRVB_01670 [Candidatus Cardinium hertigii]|uniref:hypothetical protein n=1 Tax=Candidatus Cardinium hertigii TaxID=247481 RepID=UPI003D7E39B6
MKINFYTKPFRLILSMYMACCLFGSCSKLGSRYGMAPNMDQGHRDNIENPDASLTDSTQKLFKAIKDSNLEKVHGLLATCFDHDAFMDLCQTNAHGNTCLHVAAGDHRGKKSMEAAKIMKYLLNKMKPLLLTEEDFQKVVDHISHIPNETLIKDPIFCDLIAFERTSFCVAFSESASEDEDDLVLHNWEDRRSSLNICDATRNLLKNIQTKRYNSRSELMRKNNKGETPICAAINYGDSCVFDALISDTHKLIGLNLSSHTGRPLSDIFEELMDRENTNKLKDLVNQYALSINIMSDGSHGCNGYFLHNECEACNIAKEIKNKQNNKPQSVLAQDQKLNEEERRIRTVLCAVGIEESKIDAFFASIMRSPASNALSACAASNTTTSSSKSRGHIPY